METELEIKDSLEFRIVKYQKVVNFNILFYKDYLLNGSAEGGSSFSTASFEHQQL